jgi:hypothetical protein
MRLDGNPKQTRRAMSRGRRNEEFAADFYLVSKRTLTPAEFRIFKYHFLLGADWRLCCRKLKTERGIFFHAVYRIEQKLGKTFRELEPYSLYPIDEYFNGVSEHTAPPSNVIAMPPRRESLASRVPLKVAA